MKAHTILLSALLTATLAAQDTPNIIFLLADDMGIGDIGVYNQNARAQLGLPAIATPNLDALAAQGIRFTNMHSNPMCGPSRSTLTCGFHQGHAKVDRNQSKNNAIQPGDHEKSWASILQEAGYRTGLFGRWHLRGYNIDTLNVFDVHSTPLGKGFERLWNNAGSGGGYRQQMAFVDNDNGNGVLENSDLMAVQRPRSTDPNDQWALANGGLGVAPEYEVLTSTNKALEFLSERIGSTEPFMAFVPIYATHTDTNEVPNAGDYAGLGYPQAEANYAAAVASVDEALGRIMAMLRDPNGDGDTTDSIVDQTMVVFSSDNGNQSASHNIHFFGSTRVYRDDGDDIVESGDFLTLRGEKFDVFEGGTNGPFIIQWSGNPHIVPGSVHDRMATFADWVPTIAELVGAEVPLGVDGVSFLADLTGGTSERPDFRIHSSQNGWAIAMNGWKLVNSGGLRLYHLPSDPGESAPVNNRSDIVNALQTLAIAEGITSDANLTGPDANTWFSQYKDWAPVGGSADFFSAANWTGGIPTTLYPNSGGSAAANWNSPPAANWIASMVHDGTVSQTVSVASNATLLALELQASAAELQLHIETGVVFTVSNGLRLRKGAHLALNGATLRTQRELEILPGATLSGSGVITGNQHWLVGISEFAGQGFLEPHVLNAGRLQPQPPTGSALPPPEEPPGNPEDFLLLDNFDALSSGNIGGQNGWSAPSLATVIADPDAAGKVLQIAGTGSLGVAHKALGTLTIADGATGTVFMRVRASAAAEHALGLSDKSSPSTWGDYEAQLNWKNGGSVTARDAGSESAIASYSADEWHNIWMVIDNHADRYAVYIADDSQPGAADASNLVFRNSNAAALTSFLAMVSTNAISAILIDDIYIDPTHLNLQVPAGVTLPNPDNQPTAHGILTIEGRFTQQLGGVLALDISGTDNSDPSAPQYEHIAITGAAQLDGSLAITLADGFSPQQGDTFTILTAASISGRFDHADDTVFASDGTTAFRIHYSPTSVTLEAQSSLSAAETWRQQWFSQTTNSGNAADHVDFDKDGLPNLLERAFGSNPRIAGESAVDGIPPATSLVQDGGSDRFLALTYRRIAGGSTDANGTYRVADLHYTIEYDNNLVPPWSPGAVQPVGLPTTNPDGTETATIRLTQPFSSNSTQFIRLKVSTD